jgi:hypothetical protein
MKRVGLRRVLAVVAASLVAAGCTSGGSAAKGTTTTSTTVRPAPTTTTLPTVPTSATPAGWVPVDFGEAQISVPADWYVGYNTTCRPPAPPGTVFVGTTRTTPCPSVPLSSVSLVPVVYLAPLTNVWDHLEMHASHVNGIRVEQVGSGDVYLVPNLGVVLSASGPGVARVVHSLTRSPAAVVLAHGPAPPVPPSWRTVTAGGVRFAVPGSWTTTYTKIDEGSCGFEPALYPAGGVVVDSDKTFGAPSCPPPPQLSHVDSPTDGVILNLRAGSPALWQAPPALTPCLHRDGLVACTYPRSTVGSADQFDELDIIFVQVTVPGQSGHELLEIGLAGDGMVARTILYSLRAA